MQRRELHQQNYASLHVEYRMDIFPSLNHHESRHARWNGGVGAEVCDTQSCSSRSREVTARMRAKPDCKNRTQHGATCSLVALDTAMQAQWSAAGRRRRGSVRLRSNIKVSKRPCVACCANDADFAAPLFFEVFFFDNSTDTRQHRHNFSGCTWT